MATSVVLDPTLRIEIEPASLAAEETSVREEIKGLIRVYTDGRVDRHPVVPLAAAEVDDDPSLSCRDIVVDQEAKTWARLYVPGGYDPTAAGPAVAYFHGGGFCVGSAAWACYHEFAARLARDTGRAVLSAEYRLAPESPLPAAYEDAARCVRWLLRGPLGRAGVVLMGDSAGANIAYRLLGTAGGVRGAVLVQPFFGGEARTASEAGPGGGGALSLAASDAYWRMALPPGADRDHPCCNPLAAGSRPAAAAAPVMVCVSELDILRDRNLEFSAALASGGGCAVRCEVYAGVGHAFQILGRSGVARTRTNEMMDDIKDFISTCV